MREGQLSKFTTLYADDYRVQLPAGWMAFEEIASDCVDQPIEYLPPERLREDRANRAKGAPRYYTIVTDEIQFSPVSDAERTITITYYARLKLSEDDPRAKILAVGDAGHIAGLFHRFIEAGVHKFVAVPIVGDSEDLMAQTRLLAEQVLPRVEDRVPA